MSSFRLSRLAPEEFALRGPVGTIEINPTLGNWSCDRALGAPGKRTLRSVRVDEPLRMRVESVGDALRLHADAGFRGDVFVAELSLMSELSTTTRVESLPQYFFHSAGLHFCASSAGCERFTIELEAASLERERRTAIFAAGFETSSSVRELRIPWASFEKVAGDERTSLTDAMRAGFRTLRFVAAPSPEQRTIDLYLHGPIEPDRELRTSDAEGDVVLSWLRSVDPVRLSGFGAPLGDLPLLMGRSLADPKHREGAIEAARSGTLIRDLRARGFGFRVLGRRLPVDSSFFEMMHDGVRAIVLVELGKFGEDHGALSHAMQLWAITAGLDCEQISRVHSLFARMRVSLNAWAVWHMIFDSTRGINSPRYWRDILQGLPGTTRMVDELGSPA